MENDNKKRGRPSKVKDMDAPFATRLRELGENMTHQEIADGVGVSRQTIGQFMLGNTRPDIDTLGKLADFFSVSTDYLLCRTDIKSPDVDLKGVCKYTGLDENSINHIVHMCKEDSLFKKTNSRALKAFFEERDFLYELDRYAILFIRTETFKQEILKKFIKDNYPNITEKEIDERGTHIFDYRTNKTHSKFGDDDVFTAEHKFEEVYKQAKEIYSIIDSGLNKDIGYEAYKLQQKVASTLSGVVIGYYEYEEEYNKIKEYYSNAIDKCTNEEDLKAYYLNNFQTLYNIIHPDNM